MGRRAKRTAAAKNSSKSSGLAFVSSNANSIRQHKLWNQLAAQVFNRENETLTIIDNLGVQYKSSPASFHRLPDNQELCVPLPPPIVCHADRQTLPDTDGVRLSDCTITDRYREWWKWSQNLRWTNVADAAKNGFQILAASPDGATFFALSYCSDFFPTPDWTREDIRGIGSVPLPRLTRNMILIIKSRDGTTYRISIERNQVNFGADGFAEGSLKEAGAFLHPKVRHLMVLKFYKLAARVGDINVLDRLLEPARDAGSFLKLESEYAAATNEYLSFLTHPQDLVYYGVCAGVAHENSALTLRKMDRTEEAREQQIAAVVAYRKATEVCMSDHVHSDGMRAHTFNCLGLALKRIGEWDMASRAYAWALSDETQQQRHYETVANNFLLVLQQQDWSEKKLRKHDKKSVQRQAAAQKEICYSDPRDGLCFECSSPVQSKLKKCSQCSIALYCCKEHQAAHWQQGHRNDCKLWRNRYAELFNEPSVMRTMFVDTSENLLHRASLFGAAAAGSGLFAAAAPAGSGLFAAASTSPAREGGGLFGGEAPAAASPDGLFGAAAAAPASGGLFGAAVAASPDGLFGAAAPPAPPVAGGLFGAAPAASPAPGGGMFGAAAAPASPAPASGELFVESNGIQTDHHVIARVCLLCNESDELDGALFNHEVCHDGLCCRCCIFR